MPCLTSGGANAGQVEFYSAITLRCNVSLLTGPSACRCSTWRP